MTGIRPSLALLLLIMGGCGAEPREITVPFSAVFGQQALSCGVATPAGSLTDLRFYVSEIQLHRGGSGPIDLALTVDKRWQGPSVALIDLEDGTGECQNGTPGMHSTLVGQVPAGDYRGISFVVGVPFGLNHDDPLMAEPPLGDSAMHWHWRAGYKFLRAGFATDARSHWLHLGSAGCEGAIQSITHCRFPNRVAVTIENYVPGNTLLVDLAGLFDAFSTADDPRSSCSSGPAEESCKQAFAVFGLDHVDGEQHDQQRLVRLAR